jgi:hypothetical protein
MNTELIKTLENREKKNIMLMIEERSRPLSARTEKKSNHIGNNL